MSSRSTGYTVIWDLHNKHEVVALAYGGAGRVGIISGSGGEGMSDVAWHPDNVRAACHTLILGAQNFAGYPSCHIIRGRHVACDHGLGSAQRACARKGTR